MKRKTIFLFFSVLVLISMTKAQDYQIDFAGTGASTTVDSVKVENLTQCTDKNLVGSNILHLTGTVGINELSNSVDNTIRVYPNPTTGLCLIDFEAPVSGKASIGLYDITGRRISHIQELLAKGKQTYQLSWLGSGIYTLRIESDKYSFTAKIVSSNITAEISEIKHIETIPAQETPNIALSTENNKSLKSIKSIIDMQYTTGDLLKFTGFSGGIYKTVFMLVPTSSQTVTFNFVDCTDADGNHYVVVKIGTQIWMAENLNYGTYVTAAAGQGGAGTQKYCYDNNTSNCTTYGGLYEWAEMMDGSASCNGTAPPPDANAQCSPVVQGICPAGWHVPSHYEWTLLEKNIGSNPSDFPYDETTTGWLGTDEGGNLKETCASHWASPNTGATNSSGWTALPGGNSWSGSFSPVGNNGYWWSATEADAAHAWTRHLYYSNATVSRGNGGDKLNGFSVRCVQD